jgi:hypothetical protein
VRSYLAFGFIVAFAFTSIACSGASGGSPSGGAGGQTSGGGTVGTAGAAGTAATGGAGGSIGPGGNVGVAGSAAAGTGGSAAMPDIVFSPPSRTFEGELQVTMSTPSGSFEIRYTTDGQAPTATSTLYQGEALRLTATTQVRAEAFVAGGTTGLRGTGVYIARSFDMSVDLPIVLIDAYGHGALSTTDRSFVDAAFMTFDLAGGAASLSSPPTVASRAGFHIRGNSSASFPKTPYRIELRGPTDQDQDRIVLGMPAESDWVLHGPYPDKALIRNAFVYGLGRDMGMPAPRFAFAEFYLNVAARPLASGDYLGVYLLVESLKNQKDRLNIKQLEPEDIAPPAVSGGYIFKFELLAAEPPLLTCMATTTTCWKDMELVDPEPVQPAQQTYITQYIQSFHDALNGTSYTDPTTGYAAYSNPATFVDQMIIHELSRNMDAYVRSQYFYKDRDAKISAGPLWDYDLTFDVGGFFDNRNTQGWQHQQSAVRNGVNNTWFQRMLTDPAFLAQVVARWKTLRQGMLSDAQIDARINTLTAGLTNGAARNFARWPILTTARVAQFNTPTQSTWQAQVENMRTWVKARAAWLDTQWM